MEKRNIIIVDSVTGVMNGNLRLLLESAKDYAIFTLDMERRVTSWNAGAELMLGYSEQEILGQSGDIFFVPEDRAKNAPEWETEKASKEGVAENERWHLRKDGSRFYGSGTSRPLYNDKGEQLGFVKIMRDMTEDKRREEALRASEERLRITMESATDYAIMTLDTEGNYTEWSKGAEQIFGFTEPEVLGKHTELIFTPEDREQEEAEKEITTARLKGRAEDERWHMRKDGSRLFMSGVMRPIYNDNVLIGYVKVARNITEQKLLEKKKDDFIGIASHELKTPVTSIKAYVELLQETLEQTEGESPALIQKLNNQVDRLGALIHTLLDTTMIAEGQLELHPETFDINQLLQEIADDMQNISKRHKLVLQREKVSRVKADRERISQVITNIISNAIKYSPAGGEVIITTKDDGNKVQVSVQDQGIGMSANTINNIFDRFYREGNPSIQTFPGIGLGLYIAAEIVKMHGGRIWAESEKGEGATFYFTIPGSPDHTKS